MKNSPYFKSIISLILVLITALLGSCGSRSNSYSQPPIISSGTETDSISAPSHLDKEESSETETESVVIENAENKTEAVTEIQTEVLTEKVTVIEVVTEKVEVPVTSLRYISYNNGTCGVAGIGNCTDACVVIPQKSPDGDIVTAIEDKAFYGNTDIKAIEIPSTVSNIGNMAFGGCTSLVYISVDKNNKSFTDINGILYSIDCTQLIAYPASCGLSELSISASVTKISDMAFYGCTSLKSINYGGTLESWGKIDIGEMNYGLFTASVKCSNTLNN